MTIEAMKQALEALEKHKPKISEGSLAWITHDQAITALRTAIEQSEKQGAVAWMDEFGNVFPLGAQRGPKYLNEPMKPLYTTPPAAQRQPLTDEEIRKFADTHLFYQPEGYEVSGIFNLARAIEAAHGITGEKPDAA